MSPSDKLPQLLWDCQWILSLAPVWLCSDPMGWHLVGEDTALSVQEEPLGTGLFSPGTTLVMLFPDIKFFMAIKTSGWTIPKQFPIRAFWFHENDVSIGNKLFPLNFWWKPGRQRVFSPTPCMAAGIMVGDQAACPSSGTSSFLGCLAALFPNCLTSWLASCLASQLPVQKFLKHALCDLKTIIRFYAKKLCCKAKSSLFLKTKTEIKKYKIGNRTKIALHYLFSFNSSLCTKKRDYHGNITCISKSKGLRKPFFLRIDYSVYIFTLKIKCFKKSSWNKD